MAALTTSVLLGLKMAQEMEPMPRRPNGERRPGNTVGAAVMVAKISTGELEGAIPAKGHRGGLTGGKVRAFKLTPEQRRAITRRATQARWKQS